MTSPKSRQLLKREGLQQVAMIQRDREIGIENLSILNRLGLNIHTQDTETNDSIKLKRLDAGWDNDKNDKFEE